MGGIPPYVVNPDRRAAYYSPGGNQRETVRLFNTMVHDCPHA
jgi:hypothetical protein